MVSNYQQRLVLLMNDKIKILYITGMGRSGTTILDNTLGQIEGFFSVGEINYVWDRNIVEGRTCSCGAPFKRCEIWSEVMDRAYGGMSGTDPHEMISLRDSVARTRHVPLMVMGWGRPLLRRRIEEYLRKLEKLYWAVQVATDSRVIVDSSKLPSYGHILGMSQGIDLYVVHLVRDPRAVAYSWMREKWQPDAGEYMSRYSPPKSSLVWNTWNLMAEAFWKKQSSRYLRLRYEDFVVNPRENLACILNFVEEEAFSLPARGHLVNIGVNHTVGGNPSRFKTGAVELRLDDEWRTKMKRLDEKIVSSITWPLRTRYGYTDDSFRKDKQP